MTNRNKTKISIITATYNSEATLEQTIASVVRQDYPYIEFILIDGASTDGTLDIIRKYKDIKGLKWISEPDKGIYDALNKGIDMATGDYIQIIGSDDALYSINTISNVVEQLDGNTDILSAAVMSVDDKTKTQAPWYNHNALARESYRGGMIPHQGMFVKKTLIKKLKFDTSYKIAADYKFFLQCYFDDNVKIKYIDNFVAFFTNSGTSSNQIKAWDEDNRIYNELGLTFHSPVIYSPNHLKRFIKEKMWEIGILSPAMEILNRYRHRFSAFFVWEKHTCDNSICRWCGRR